MENEGLRQVKPGGIVFVEQRKIWYTEIDVTYEHRGNDMYRYNIDIFTKDLELLGITLTEEQIGQFIRYYELLVEWNRKVNLTAITGYNDVIKKHFVDSLSVVKACNISGPYSLIDVGTGAGFPGLALKIAFPHLKVTLLDSLNKRILFLDTVIRELGLTQVEAIHGRAEDFAKPGKLREEFDLCVSRAVANLSSLCEYCLPFVKKQGLFIAYKSGNVSQEIKEAGSAIRLLGGKWKAQVDFTLPDSDISRSLLVIEKESATPAKYPRKAGLPGREPL